MAWDGWDGMAWDGMGWDGMAWEGKGRDGKGWDGMGCGAGERTEAVCPGSSIM